MEQAMQQELQIRDQRIRELELENIKLKVKLEQSQDDIKTAMNMIMVVSRMNQATITTPKSEVGTEDKPEFRHLFDLDEEPANDPTSLPDFVFGIPEVHLRGCDRPPAHTILDEEQCVNGAETGSHYHLDRRSYNQSSEESDEIPLRNDVKYVPAEEQHKNFLRTVVIHNIPPQADIAEIVVRASSSPLLSVKLVPTMGMKFRRANGSVGVLTTMTALLTFAIDTSAEQFVFDLTESPLVLRGQTTIAKLLDSPTYPSAFSDRAYATAPGRLSSRRIRFYQPGLVPANQFDDILAGNSYGFKQPGWIVDKSMKSIRGSNMITVEFGTIETAQFAWQQLLWLPVFQGCEPHWVYDHGRAVSNGRGHFKTKDDEDFIDGQVLGEVEGGSKEGRPSAGLGASRYGRTLDRYEDVAPAVPSFRDVRRFALPVRDSPAVELDY